MRIRAKIEVEYEVDPKNLSIHENVMYQEHYRLLTGLRTFFNSSDIGVHIEDDFNEPY